MTYLNSQACLTAEMDEFLPDKASTASLQMIKDSSKRLRVMLILRLLFLF
jgi:hypothetical protein